MDIYYYLIRAKKNGEAIFICNGPGDIRLDGEGGHCKISHDGFKDVWWSEYISESQYETYRLFGMENCGPIRSYVYGGGEITITGGNGGSTGHGGDIRIYVGCGGSK